MVPNTERRKHMRVEAKLEGLGLTLPGPPKLPPGVQLSVAWVRVHQDRAYVAGQGPLNPNGTIAEPLGKVGVDLSPEQGYQAARLSALTVLSSLKCELGDLDRDGLAYGLRLGQRRSRLHPDHQRDQRLLGSDLGSVRTRGGHARPH